MVSAIPEPARLPPMVDWIGSTPIEHGERGYELDIRNPDACLCGELDYQACPDWPEGGIASMTFSLLAKEPDNGQ